MTFTAADTDTDIPNPFPRDNPEDVRWQTVAVSPAAIVYRAAPPNTTAWTATTLILRATAACTVRVLFTLERP